MPTLIPEAKTTVPTADAVQEFDQLAARWRQETLFSSSANQMAQNEAYQEIIRLGLPAVPLILHEMQQKPGHWFLALHAITGENPAEDVVGFDVTTEAWLHWGKRKGYIS